MRQGLHPLSAFRGVRAGGAGPQWLAPLARVSHALCADVSDWSVALAVQKLDSRRNPGDSSGCQNLAPPPLLFRPRRICEAGDFLVIPGEDCLSGPLRFHELGHLFALCGTGQSFDEKGRDYVWEAAPESVVNSNQ